MKKTILAISMLLFGWAAPLPAEIMTYQGRLKDNSLPANGNYAFAFDFCDAAQTACFASTDNPQNFLVANGLFKSTFTMPAVDLAAQAWYLRVSVGGSVLSPLERLTAVPYAAYSAAAVRKTGDTMTGQLTLAGSTLTVMGSEFSVGVTTFVVKNGNVGIGTTSPASPLHVNVGNSGFLAISYDDIPGGWGDVAFVDNTSGNRKWGVGALSDSHASMPNSWYVWQNVNKNETSVSRYRLVVGDKGYVGISSDTPNYLLVISSGAGEAGDMVVISTGNSNVIRLTGGGEVFATRFFGDGSGITGVTGAVDPAKLPLAGGLMSGDINMGGHDVLYAGRVSAGYYAVNGTTVIALLPGIGSVSYGPAAGLSDGGAYNLFVGSAAGLAHLSGANNVMLGYGAGSSNTTGAGNTFLGASAGSGNGTGVQNIVIGYNQQTSASSAVSELNIGGVIFGQLGLKTIGISTRVPQAALDIVSTGTAGNIYTQFWRDSSGVLVASMSSVGHMQAVRFIGDGSGLTGVTGATGTDATKLPLSGGTMSGSIDMAANSLYAVSTVAASGYVTAARYQILGSTVIALSGVGSFSAGVGAGSVNVGNYGTFLGSFAGAANTGGNYNSYMGYNAGAANTLGAFNSMAGAYAGPLNTTGSSNSVFGYGALGNNLTGSANSVVGTQAGKGFAGDSFSSATLMGYRAGYSLTTGSGNTFLGWQAGYGVTTGNNNIVIGQSQDAPSPGSSSQINIGGVLFGDQALKTIGISTRAPEAALDVVATGATAAVQAQIWRNSAGAIVSSVSATGQLQAVRFIGDGSGLTNVAATTGVDASKVAKAGDTMTGPLQIHVGADPVAFQVGISTLVVKDGLVGINTSAPLEALHLGAGNIRLAAGQRLLWDSNDLSLYADGTGLAVFQAAATRLAVSSDGGFTTVAAGDIFGVSVDTTSALHVVAKGLPTGDGRAAVFGDLRSNGSAAGQYLAGGNFETAVEGTDSAELAAGLRTAIRRENAGAGVVNNVYGVMIDDLQNQAGSVTNTYGLYIGDQTSGTQTNPAYALYSADASARSYFAGNLGVGIPGPAYSLDVLETIRAYNPAGGNGRLILGDGDIAHGMTGLAPTTDTFGLLTANSSTGGLHLAGYSSLGTAPGLYLAGVIGDADPADGIPAVTISGAKKNAAVSQPLGAAETVLAVNNGGGAALATVLGSGNVGVSTGAPQARLDVLASASDPATMAQIWRNSAGAIVSSVSAAGYLQAVKFVGDGSGLTNVAAATGTDATKVAKTGDTMTGPLTMSGASADIVSVSSITTSGNFFGDGSQLTNLNASTVLAGTLADARLSATVTLKGNTFNGPSGLVMLDAAAKLPAVDGSVLTGFTASQIPALDASKIATGKFYDSQMAISTGAFPGGFNAGNQLVKLDAAGAMQLTVNNPTPSAPVVLALDSSNIGEPQVEVRTNNYRGRMSIAGTNGGMYFGSLTPNFLAFHTAGVEWMRLTTQGYLGIGTGAPQHYLHLSSNTSTSSNTLLKLADTGTGAPQLLLEAGGHQGRMATAASNGGTYIGTLTNDFLVFETNAAERLKIAADGKIGSGGINPTEALDIASRVKISTYVGNADTDGLFSYGTNGMKFQSNGVTYMYAAHGGNYLGLGGPSVNSSAGAPKVQVQGSMSVGSTYNSAMPPANSLVVENKVGIGAPIPAFALDVSTVNIADSVVARFGPNGIVVSTGGAVQTTGAGNGIFAGNPRGNGAVDLQTMRLSGAQAATGNYSVIGGGYGNTASSANSVVAGGQQNTASNSYAVVGGGITNSASAAYATVSGGMSGKAAASFSNVSGGYSNEVYGEKSAVGGGWYNVVSGSNSAIGGGTNNTVYSTSAVIAGGEENKVMYDAYAGFIGGGAHNISTAPYSVVGGGLFNTSSGTYSGVLGGHGNEAAAVGAAIVGGEDNYAGGIYSFVGGGRYNSAPGLYSAIAGGDSNNTDWGQYAAIGGGARNFAYGYYSAIPGGADNYAGGQYSFSAGRASTSAADGSFTWKDSLSGEVLVNGVPNQVWFKAAGGFRVGGSTSTADPGLFVAGDGTVTVGNGISISRKGALQTVGLGTGSMAPGVARDQTAVDLQTNREQNYQVASGYAAVIAGGASNRASADRSVVSGGQYNSATSQAAAVVGGWSNSAAGAYSFVGSGAYNSVAFLADYSVIGGGWYNSTPGGYAVVGGGLYNTALSTGAVGGGGQNYAFGAYSAIPGGRQNTARGMYSFAAGYKSSSTADGTFTWADSTGVDFENTGTDQVMFKAKGGFWVSTGTVYTDPAFYVRPDNRVAVGLTATLSAPARLQVNGDLGLGDGTQTGNAPVVIWLTAAAAVADGDIVVASGGNQFSTTMTAPDYRAIGVAVGATAGGSIGKVAVGGVAVVNCTGATAGQHAVTSATAGMAAATGTPVSGTSIGQFLTSCGTPVGGKAYLLVK
ncbi:MAG: hypothetical protein ACYC2I_00435 [Elusimicrobiales bacterium]